MTFLAGLFLGILGGAVVGAWLTWRVIDALARREVRATGETSIATAARDIRRAMTRREPARFVEAITPKEEERTDLQKRVKEGIHPGAAELEGSEPEPI